MRCARSLLAVTLLGGSIAAAADVPAPTIRALRVPPPNAAGWNNTVVVVSFECRNAVRCPDDKLLEMDGSGLSIKRVVFNRDGASAETEAVANIDRVPATVQITSTEALSVDRLRVTA